MAGAHQLRRRTREVRGAAQLAVIMAALLLAVGCSPENGRPRGELGADVGNTTLPVEMRGNQGRNNPSFQTPVVGQVPRDAKGVPGWWVGGGN
jgi:hypothetical protein